MAKKFIVSVAIRMEQVENSGKIYVVDFSSGQIEKTVSFIMPCTPLDAIPNPGGGLRGFRGVEYFNGLFYVANFDSILVYDKNFILQRSHTHPWLADIHQIKIYDDQLYVVSTFAEAVISIPINTWIDNISVWEGRYVLDKKTDYRKVIEPESSGHFHYSSIARHEKTKDIYILATQKNIITNIHTGQHFYYPEFNSPHNIVFIRDYILAINDTNNARIAFLDLQPNPLSPPKFIYNDIRIIRQEKDRCVGANYGWLRGMDFDGEYLYIGSSPARIKAITLDGELAGEIELSNSVRESIFDVKLVDI